MDRSLRPPNFVLDEFPVKLKGNDASLEQVVLGIKYGL